MSVVLLLAQNLRRPHLLPAPTELHIMTRTAQPLLAERRALIQEWRRPAKEDAQ